MSSVEDFKINPEKELGKLYKISKNKFISTLIKKFPMPQNDALEIFQKAVVILWENIENNKFTTGKLEPYLRGVINNLALEYTRKVKKERIISNSEYAHEIIKHDHNDLVEYNKERIELLKKAIEELEGPCATLLRLSFYKLKSNKEIQGIMQYKNLDTLKSKKYKCLKRLRSLIIDISSRK